MAGTFRITGTTNGREEDGAVDRMLHDFAIEVDPERVKVDMQGLGGGATGAVESRHPAVRKLMNDVKVLQDRTAYRNRPVTSYWKPASKASTASAGRGGAAAKSTSRTTMVLCPKCDGLLSDCPLCDGEFAVTPRAAEEWLISQGRERS